MSVLMKCGPAKLANLKVSKAARDKVKLSVERKRKIRLAKARRKKEVLVKLREGFKSKLYQAYRNKKYIRDKSLNELLGIPIEVFGDYLGVPVVNDYILAYICPPSQARTREELDRLHHHTNFEWRYLALYMPEMDRYKSKVEHKRRVEAKCLELLGRPFDPSVNSGSGFLPRYCVLIP